MKESNAISLNLPKEAIKPFSCKAVRHYDSSNMDQFVWPESEMKSFLAPLLAKGTKHYIDNIDAEINLLVIDSHVIPIVIVEEKYENSFVCSPYGHYISYALESSAAIFKQKFLSTLVNGFVGCLGYALRKGKVNKIVYVNNWLFPTDLHCKDLKQEHVVAITHHLIAHFPDYAIAFKSINMATDPELQAALHEQRYDHIITRQIFLTDTKKEEIFRTRIFKSDVKMLRETAYTVVDKKELKAHDLEKILSLYKKLYLEKYSKLNPQHNQNFIDLVYQSDFFQLKAIRKENEIEGFFGYFIRDGIMTAPLFGYEEKTSEKSLYRLLSTLLTLEAKERGCILHQSAGASFYKKVRRAEPCMEFMAVYTKHLPYLRQLPWKMLKIIMNSSAYFFKNY